MRGIPCPTLKQPASIDNSSYREYPNTCLLEVGQVGGGSRSGGRVTPCIEAKNDEEMSGGVGRTELNGCIKE